MTRRRVAPVVIAAVVGSLLGVAGAPPAQALPPCPQLEGWTGPDQGDTSESDRGGSVRCRYVPGPGSSIPSNADVLIEGLWVGPAEVNPDAVMPFSGCGRDYEYAAARTQSSDGRWASITYSVFGLVTSADNAAVFQAEQGRLLDAVAALMPYLEALAQPCNEEVVGTEPVAPTDRVAGTSRYETAAEVAQVWSTAGVVYVATGQNFPDALGGGPAAAAEGAPILLVEKGSIPTTTGIELDRLSPSRIVVLGGTGVISDGVVAALRTYTPTVDRVAGLDRYATAAAVSAYAFPGTNSTVYIASGRAFADPIIAGAAAALDGAPLLLVDGHGPLEPSVAAELVRLQPSEIVVVGAASDLDGVLATLELYGAVRHVGQSDVYARSAALWDGVAPGVTEVVLATSGAFADALAGTPYAAMEPVSHLMLSRSDCVPPVVRTQMERLAPDRVRLLGGTAALSADIERQATC